MFDPDETFFQEEEWRTPVISLKSGNITKWEKDDGQWVRKGTTICIIRPIVPGAADWEVPAPASGRLGIVARFKRLEEPFVRGIMWGEEADIIAYIYKTTL